jgi:hypothetical protein
VFGLLTQPSDLLMECGDTLRRRPVISRVLIADATILTRHNNLGWKQISCSAVFDGSLRGNLAIRSLTLPQIAKILSAYVAIEYARLSGDDTQRTQSVELSARAAP